MSFGKQEPPKPSPAFKNSFPILWSNPIIFETSSMFAPIFSESIAISLINDIFTDKNAFEEYLDNSAVSRFVKIIGICFFKKYS